MSVKGLFHLKMLGGGGGGGQDLTPATVVGNMIENKIELSGYWI